MNLYIKKNLWITGILILTNCLFAQQNKSVLRIEDIMKGEKFTGYSPSAIAWSADGKNIYFDWNPEMKPVNEKYRYNLSTKKIDKLSINDLRNIMVSEGDIDPAKKFKTFSKNGDLYLYNLTNNTSKPITETISGEYEPIFSADGKYIIYQSGGNEFAWDKTNGSTRQLTNFVKGDKRRDGKKTSQEIYLEKQQNELFEVLRDQKKAGNMRKTINDSTRVKRPKEFFYGERNITNIVADPSLKLVCFQIEKPAANRVPLVPEFVNISGYTRDLNTRDKVGGQQSTYEFCFYDINKDTVTSFDRTMLTGIFEQPAYYREYTRDSSYTGISTTPREVNYFGPIFNKSGKAILEIKSQDHKDRWLVLIDPNGNDKYTILDRQHDDAWIGGPGIEEWSNASGTIGWIDEENFWYQSEMTGYSHLYRQNILTKEKKSLTSGNFEILNVQISGDHRYFYVSSNKVSPFEHHFYKLSVNGGEMEQITQIPGNHEVSVSPDEKYLAIRYSFTNKPWELYIMENKAGAKPEQLTQSTTAQFNKYKWREPEIIKFTASDGVKVPARLYKPENPNGAGVIFVHGAGYLQNVHKWWSNYYREFMFHNMLADNGYTVLDIDYRASDGYGRDWRTAIYRYMGNRDLDDQVDGAKFLVDSLGVNKNKLGIYGGSYGGFITLMAQFTRPGVFKCGAALRSVTDWAHYNHEYTSNILNTPTEDSISFKRSSPIYFAEGLQDRLLILHGMIDTNVHFQDVVRLAQRLVELRKDNWEFAVFPVEDHGFKEASSWTDEYKRIYKMFDETLRDQTTKLKN
jgi:dipeptidyl aminopeptidase/acylaminoacyl peptidase